MSKANSFTEGYEEGCGEAGEVLGESQESCADLASEFGDFVRECGAQIWAMKTLAETLAGIAPPSDLVSPEQIICVDVLNICSALSRAGGIPDGFAAVLCAIVAEVDPTRFNLEVMNDPATESVVSDWLANRLDGGISKLAVVQFLAQHDKMNGGSLARRAASMYSLLVMQLFSFYLPSSLDRPGVVTAVGQVANDYLKQLYVYLDPNETGDQSDRSNTENAGEHSNTSRKICSECSDAYDLLELPFGAVPDEVKSAQRELAKNLHPDVWVNKRGAQGAEEQLKQINAACDHLLKCRWPTKQTDGVRSRRRNRTNVVMPQMGQSITEGTLTKWLKEVGDSVERDESLFEISTDKGDVEIPCPVAGTVSEIKVAAGAMVAVNTVVAVISKNREVVVGPRPVSNPVPQKKKARPSQELTREEHVRRSKELAKKKEPKFSETGPINASGEHGQQLTSSAGQRRASFWRVAEVFLRAVWRFTKIVLAIVLGVVAAAPTAQVNSEPTASSPGNGDRQLLWDYTRNEQIPELPEEMKQKLRELIGPVTHHEDDMSFGPELIGAFYSGQPPDSQTVYSVTLPWIDIEGRSHAEGDLSFIVVATGDQLDVYEGQYAGKILSLVRSPGAGVDLMLIEYEWSGQGEDQKYLRILSVADRSLKLVTDVGMGLINDYATAQPLREVADRIYYRAESDGSITILPREHFLLQDGPPKELGMDSDDANRAFGHLLDRAKHDDPKTEDQTPQNPSSQDSATEPELQATLDGRANATQANDLATELGYYGDTVDRYFLARNVTREFIRKDKERFYRIGERFISYRIDNVSVDQSSPDEAVALLTKHWVVEYAGGNTHSDQTNSRLWLKQEQARWVITGEQDLK